MPGANRKKYKSRSEELLKQAGSALPRTNDRQIKDSKTKNRTSSQRKQEAQVRSIRQSPARGQRTSMRRRNIFFRRMRRRMRSAGLIPVFACSFVAVLLLFGTVFMLTNKNATEVFVNDVSIGKVQNVKLTNEELNKTITAKIQETVGNQDIRINETIQLEIVHGSKKELISEDALVSALMQKITYDVAAGVIRYNGQAHVTLESVAQAEAVKQELLNAYLPDGEYESVTMEFVEDFSIEKVFADQSAIITTEEALSEFRKTIQSQKVYTVQNGDNPGLIAEKNGMALEQLYELNSGLTHGSIIRPGDQIQVVSQEPLLSVKVIQTVKYEEVIPCEVIEQNDPALSNGVSNVIEEGKDGLKEITKKITSINGLVQSEEAVDETVIQDPVPRVIARGTGAN